MIALGSTWRIGNGTNVLIIRDKWLPDPHSRNFLGNTQVCALINEEESSWLFDRVNMEILPYEAQAILMRMKNVIFFSLNV